MTDLPKEFLKRKKKKKEVTLIYADLVTIPKGTNTDYVKKGKK